MFTNTWKRWTSEEVALLRRLITAHVPKHKIAKLLGRSRSSVLTKAGAEHISFDARVVPVPIPVGRGAHDPRRGLPRF
jgi:hypothetical protein